MTLLLTYLTGFLRNVYWVGTLTSFVLIGKEADVRKVIELPEVKDIHRNVYIRGFSAKKSRKVCQRSLPRAVN